VLRSETESGRVALRLVGELDLNTVELLEAALARTRDQPAPSVIDLSELRFLDLIGLQALRRAIEVDTPEPVRLVGATGTVRRLIELVRTIDEAPDATPHSAPATTVAAEWADGNLAPCPPYARRSSSPLEAEKRA
jgi:anti-anti-sigma factor